MSNHSGGAMTPTLVLAPAFYEKLGYDRPLTPWRTTAVQDATLAGTLREDRRHPGHARQRRQGVVVRWSGAGVPGGDYDSYRSTFAQNVIDFNGRKGYVRTAIQADVPIVPAVSIGGQETQLFWVAAPESPRIGAAGRSDRHLPLGIGFPFG